MSTSRPLVPLPAAHAVWLEDGRFRQLSPDTLREYRRVSAAVLDFVAAEWGRMRGSRSSPRSACDAGCWFPGRAQARLRGRLRARGACLQPLVRRRVRRRRAAGRPARAAGRAPPPSPSSAPSSCGRCSTRRRCSRPPTSAEGDGSVAPRGWRRRPVPAQPHRPGSGRTEHASAPAEGHPR